MKLKVLNNPRTSAGEGICPECYVNNDNTAIINRQLIRQVNAQAAAIEDLVTEIESISEMLRKYRSEHVEKKQG